MTNIEMLEALRELHQPYIPAFVDVERPLYGGMCRHCSTDVAENSLAIAHPCPTLLAVDPEAQAFKPEYWRFYSRFSEEQTYQKWDGGW